MALRPGSYNRYHPRLDSDSPMSPSEDRNHGQFLAPHMDRTDGSSSSKDTLMSFNSMGPYQDQNYGSSPVTSYDGSPASDNGMTPRRPLSIQPQDSNFMSPMAMERNDSETSFSRTTSAELPLFNIEKEGDPRISWRLYYDFIVTKTEAFYKLQPGYLPTVNYPSHIPIKSKSAEKNHPCRVLGCDAAAFTRHYDLERHFRTRHDPKETFYCDYPKCPNKAPFRKDHCREHYREYHTEDLLKRGDDPTKANEFLSGRVRFVNAGWWRCSRCLQRVKVSKDDYQCKKCKAVCEPERKAWRKQTSVGDSDFEARDMTSGSNLPPSRNVTNCGECENMWLPDDNNNTGWIPCPKCQS